MVVLSYGTGLPIYFSVHDQLCFESQRDLYEVWHTPIAILHHVQSICDRKLKIGSPSQTNFSYRHVNFTSRRKHDKKAKPRRDNGVFHPQSSWYPIKMKSSSSHPRLCPRRWRSRVFGLVFLTALSVTAMMQTIVVPFCLFQSDSSGLTTPTDNNPGEPKGRMRHRSSSTKAKTTYSDRKPDGYFNSFPIYLETTNRHEQQNDFHSTIQCIGQTPFEDSSWMYRSCDYTYLCFDPSSSSSSSSSSSQVTQASKTTTTTTSHDDFFLVSSPIETDMQNVRRKNIRVSSPSFISTELIGSANATTTRRKAPPVALSGINPRWVGTNPNQGTHKVRWAPKVVDEPPPTYYMLDDDIVLTLFHSFAGHNVGHLLWDDFWPIYTLLQSFGYIFDGFDDYYHGNDPSTNDIDYKPLLLRVDTLPKLFASCEIQPKKRKQCQQNFEKFLPLLGIDPKSFTPLTEIQLTTSIQQQQQQQQQQEEQLPKYPICAKHAVAGMGMLTDHGKADHGWYPKQSDGVHNIGRGAQYYRFRNFMLRNIGLGVNGPPIQRQQQQQQQSKTEFRIILNENSSRDVERRVDFRRQLGALRTAFPTTEVLSVQMKDLDLKPQIELISQSSKHTIFVSTNGGGSMTSFFLPRGSSVIFYYNEQSGFDYESFKLTGGPALLDWDLFNNLSYLRVHWLPIGVPPMREGSKGTMNTDEAIDTLTYLIRHEMDVVLNKL